MEETLLGEAIRTGLAVEATLVHVTAYVVYHFQAKRGDLTPNASTWTIWVVIITMNSGAYFGASGDLLTSLLPGASSVACLITFALALRDGSFRRPGVWDGVALAVGLAAGVTWWRFDDPLVSDLVMRFAPTGASAPLVANLMLQFALLVSVIPTYRDAWKLRSEQPHAWALWGAAYTILIVAVALRTDERWTDYIHAVQGAIMHLAVVPIAILARRRA